MALQNTIACFYDCDGTLIPGIMQEPLLDYYGIETAEFLREVDHSIEEAEEIGVNLNQENAYINAFLDGVAEGKFKGLSNAELRRFGAKIKLFPGLPEFFLRTKKKVEGNPKYAAQGINLENYVLSTGFKEMILGSPLNQEGCLEQVFASELLEKEGIVHRIACSVGVMEKTKYLHEINEGIKFNPYAKNRFIKKIPFRNMIYVGDGYSDLPCFNLMKSEGGTGIAVYNPGSEEAFETARKLKEADKVVSCSPADYREGSETSKIIEGAIERIAKRIIRENK